MKKTTLCVDWGGVLVDFQENAFRGMIRSEKLNKVPAIIDAHETGQFMLRDLFLHLKKNDFFCEEMFWEDFVSVLSKCLHGLNAQMFHSLRRLKEENRARLIAITDNNPFFFYLTTLKFPEIFWLFREDGEDQIMLSYEIHSVKTQKTPFARAFSEYGFSPGEACFVDNRADNLKAAEECGFKKDSLFLYKMDDPKNHIRFEKFLDKHFPVVRP